MKIDFLHNITMPNFSSIPLYKATIKQRLSENDTEIPVDVFVTKLEYSDLSRLKRDEMEWLDTRYGEIIMDAMESINLALRRFLKNMSTIYAVEVPLSNGQKQIRAMAEVFNKDNTKEMKYLQVNNVECMPNILKGAGSCLLYAAINDAKKEEREDFHLHSNTSAMGFYRRNGLRRPKKTDSKFVLSQKMFDKRLAMLEKKYSIKTIKKGEDK